MRSVTSFVSFDVLLVSMLLLRLEAVFIWLGELLSECSY